MQYVLLFNLSLSITTIIYSLYVTLQANKIDSNLSKSCYWLLVVNAFAFGSILNRIVSGFIPYQTQSLTLIAIGYYMAELCAALYAYQFFRNKEK